VGDGGSSGGSMVVRDGSSRGSSWRVGDGGSSGGRMVVREGLIGGGPGGWAMEVLVEGEW